jgi:hypothetical protein
MRINGTKKGEELEILRLENCCPVCADPQVHVYMSIFDKYDEFVGYILRTVKCDGCDWELSEIE